MNSFNLATQRQGVSASLYAWAGKTKTQRGEWRVRSFWRWPFWLSYLLPEPIFLSAPQQRGQGNSQPVGPTPPNSLAIGTQGCPGCLASSLNQRWPGTQTRNWMRRETGNRIPPSPLRTGQASLSLSLSLTPCIPNVHSAASASLGFSTEKECPNRTCSRMLDSN